MLQIYDKAGVQMILKEPRRQLLSKEAVDENPVLQRLERAAPHIIVSYPHNLFSKLEESLKDDKQFVRPSESVTEAAKRLCLIQNERPLTTIRANTMRTTRQELLRTFTKEADIWKSTGRFTEHAPNGIRFDRQLKGNLFKMVEYKKGHFEVQDEASQLLAMRVDVRPGQTVLDYCGGSAGKSLAFAPFMHNTGQIYVHDIRKSVLMQAKVRLKRAGVQNAQVHHDKVRLRKLLKNRCDWVLLDVPCTGSGVLRRNPDLKWKFDPDRMAELLKV